MMRKILLVLSLAFAIVMLPCVSLADDDGFSGSDGGEFYQNYGLRWSGFTHDGEWTAVLAKAPDSWYAAVLACGGNPALLTPEVRSKLSDPSYGGAFYSYATTFYHIMSIYDLPIWVPVYVLAAEGISGVWHGDFGDVWLWQSEVPNTLAAAALVDYNRVVSGEGSGSDTPSTPEVVPGSFTSVSLQSYNWRNKNGQKVDRFYVTATSAVFEDGQLSVGTGTRRVSPWGSSNYYVPSLNAYVSSDAMEYAYSLVNLGYDVVISCKCVNYNGTYFSGCAGRIYYGHDLSFAETSYDGTDLVTKLFGSDLHSVEFAESPVYFDSSGPFSFIYGSPSEPHSYSDNSLFVDFFSSPIYGIENPPPAGEWPEPTAPVTPVPPEVPTPTAPTETVDPDPTAPTITWPTAPTLVLPTAPIVVETPEGIDYTELLTLINDNLNSIDAYLQNFYTSFNSFRSDFLNGVDDIVDGLRNIYQYLGHLNNILEVHCKHITDQIEESVYNLELYLKRLFEWLPRQLDFDAQYDDSAVTALLRRILNKIPGGSTGTPITYKPNPQSDEPSFWDWLADLFNRILQKLLDLLPDEMIQLGQLFGELINLFPFSIPWDLFALLALFGHEPVTPVIDIPWGYGGSSGQVMMIRIDLHAWDGVAEMVRPVFLVLFCLQLALLSRDLLKIINVKSGGE